MGRLAPSPYAPPTAREIALLITLLIFLLVVTNNVDDTFSSNQLINYPFTQSPSSTHRNSSNANYTIQPKKIETVVSWGNSERVPETVVVAHAPGWTIVDRLYAMDGTLYIVTDEPQSIPEKKFMLSTALRIANGPIEQAKRIPTDKELRVISPDEAKTLFGAGADVLDGVTVSLDVSAQCVAVADQLRKWYANDPSQL